MTRVSTVITARKQSFCEGYVFTPVCHSVHSGRACIAGGVRGRGHAWRGMCMAGACMTRGHAWRGCMWQGDMHGRGVCMVGDGVCMLCGTHAPPPRYYEIQSVNARTVRILLECILVFYNFFLTEIRASETPEELNFKTLN